MKRGLKPAVKKQKANKSDERLARSLENIRIVLCRPIYGGNIGAVCRVMANMGLSDLALVGAVNINWDEARKMACAAQDILANHKSASAIDEAAADCVLVVGATARPGLYRQHAATPRKCAPLVLNTAQRGKVALVFGTEDNGLNNIELESCNRLIQIPSSIKYRSLNLSHAVMICVYELFMASGTFEPAVEKSPEADTRLKKRMFTMWEDMLLRIGFMEPDKARHMMLGVRRIFSRGKLTEDDVRILMGIARQTLWRAEQSRDKHEKK
ncbi:MAG: RNA methyltransferase [Kiritimatiellia bacterium]|nr:RNA methyltransferase [Kiritimatiellia bacterium]